MLVRNNLTVSNLELREIKKKQRKEGEDKIIISVCILVTDLMVGISIPFFWNAYTFILAMFLLYSCLYPPSFIWTNIWFYIYPLIVSYCQHVRDICMFIAWNKLYLEFLQCELFRIKIRDINSIYNFINWKITRRITVGVFVVT